MDRASFEGAPQKCARFLFSQRKRTAGTARFFCCVREMNDSQQVRMRLHKTEIRPKTAIKISPSFLKSFPRCMYAYFLCKRLLFLHFSDISCAFGFEIDYILVINGVIPKTEP
jgi:hypothetical protein